METTKNLPTWDMSTVYPAIDSPEYAGAVETLRARIADLEGQITRAEADSAISGQPVTSAFDGLVSTLNEVITLYVRTQSYLYGLISVDSRNQEAQARASELEFLGAAFSKCGTRFTAWLGGLDEEALLASSAVAREHAYQVRKAKIEAAHLMSQAEEDLASDLALSGGSAWSRMYEDVTSQIEVTFTSRDGTQELLPMTEIRNLAQNPDRDVRKRGFEAELGAWKQWETPIAAALNGVKGEHSVVSSRQQWDSILDQAVFQNAIDRDILDAMMAAARDAFPDFRRYFAAKARALGVDKLAFYDLFAPLEADGRAWEWEDAVSFVHEQFSSFSPKMGALVERAIDEHWIDVAPRPGKTGGAFCMPVESDVSRVLLNFTPSFSEVRTLAHELGHAYHNLCEAETSPLQRVETPNTLAETASTFCETVLTHAAIASATPAEQLAYLESSLMDATQIVVDISSRFLFEQAVTEQRKSRALSADEFSELMLDAQRKTYGDGLDGDTLHPYMWAAKGHYYSSRRGYYNFPYMFGQLFGLGLFARYQEDPDEFRTNYDDLLASTGTADAATLAARFGFDLRDRAFWDGGLGTIKADIDRFESLINAQVVAEVD